jgi:hypothetical protein
MSVQLKPITWHFYEATVASGKFVNTYVINAHSEYDARKEALRLHKDYIKAIKEYEVLAKEDLH